MWASITSGTFHFLQKIADKHPRYQFYFMKNPQATVVYYEHDKKKSVFVSGRTHAILHASGEILPKGLITMEHIPVTDDGEKIFEERFQQQSSFLAKRFGVQAIRLLKQVRKQEFIILTQWQSAKELKIWQDSPYFEKYDMKKSTRFSAYFADRPFTNEYTMIEEE